MAMESDNGEEPLAARPLPPGTVVAGRYEIQRKLGTGGMASVYTAGDRYRRGAEVAIKVLHRDFAGDKVHLARFNREVQLLRKINHPNVVKTYDLGYDNDLVFFTMEYILGESLESLVETRSFAPAEIAKILLGICDGLSAIHAQGIFHRDLKPGNFLLAPNGLIKIIDFGVAREKVSNLTTKVQIVGSMCYVAPEIWLGRKLTPAADFYSLGVVLYELVTGMIPFESEHPAEVMRMHIEEPVVPPKLFKPETPDWLNHLILWLLKKTAKERPQRAEEIIEYIIQHASSELAAKTAFDGATSASRYSLHTATASGTRSSRKDPRKEYILRFGATQIFNLKSRPIPEKEARKKSVVLPLPGRRSIILEVEPSSRVFLYFGLLLASLQLFDWMLTTLGVTRYGLDAEGNPMLRHLMKTLGPHNALFAVKASAIVLVLILTYLARRTQWIKNVIVALSCLYLAAAIIPWAIILVWKI